MEPVREKPKDSRAYGRRTFLGVTALGLSSLLWGEPVWDGLARPLTQALPSGLVPSGWRIYTVAVVDADVRPGDLAAADRRSRRPAADADATPTCARCRAPSRSRPSTASPAGRSRTSTGPAFASATCSPPRARKPRRTVLEFVSAETPVRRHADARPGDAARRDARLRDGRQAARARARRAGSAS